MFSWITGPRITNVTEELQSDPAYETTFIDPPETPAHQFVAKAFKQAIFGTPAPEEADMGKKLEKKRKKIDAVNVKVAPIPPPNGDPPSLSPSKQPGGILMTPGTAAKGRKTVSFGAHVVDNEGKRANSGKSGIPNDCPGKFPSPWTPGTELKEDADKDKKPRTRLTAALYDARTTTQTKSTQKPKAKDDSDITIDLGAPRSESGKYWKEQYESYANKSEKEMRKLVAKQQMAKSFAKKKDSEVNELATRLDQERKRFRTRERELEDQNKDYQERLRQAMAENARASMEIAALKSRIVALEKSFTVPSSEVHESKLSFQIFEDSTKDSSHLQSEKKAFEPRPRLAAEPPTVAIAKPVYPARVSPEDKENSSPRPRHACRETMPDASSRPVPSHSTTPNHGQDSACPGLSTRPTQPSERSAKSTLTPRQADSPSKPLLSIRQPQASKENIPPRSPAVPQSSPLPLPSPDPWMQADFASSVNSPLPQMDRMALPISSGAACSQPEKVLHSSRSTLGRGSKSFSFAWGENIASSDAAVRRDERPVTREPRLESSKAGKATEMGASLERRFDGLKMTVHHHAEGSSLVGRDRVALPIDRKEQARRRLEQRKQKRVGNP
ncbi:spindle pole body formation-associated protein-domain-containing protein [Clohesyomyces aquaticus]|uniref:Spindle pole body formation-associated protein-domain-containing protein n=1 Tax=Clohesyomyces aquaticus TaxID=1231657 RepID=A0A1Y1ZI47_9PLEO|nr:spindle pole body formation-associated protein-domain-containing protein [Clohesyomyces aquaticus]